MGCYSMSAQFLIEVDLYVYINGLLTHAAFPYLIVYMANVIQ